MGGGHFAPAKVVNLNRRRVVNMSGFSTLQQNKTKVKQLITEDIRVMLWNDFHMPWFIAECYSLIGETELALDWLDRALEQGIINYPLFSKLDPFLENIRGEPRFNKLMERVKHEWENFEV